MVKRNSYNRTTKRHTCTCAEVKGVIQVIPYHTGTLYMLLGSIHITECVRRTRAISRTFYELLSSYN